MRLLLHQARTDVRHLRPLLLAWAAILAARAFLVVSPVGLVSPELLEGPRRSPNELMHLAMGLASVGLAVAIAVRLVQSDSPTTTTAFWLTRPVGGRTMLVAKLAVATLFLALLPTAVDVAVLAANGFSAGVLWTAAWQGLLEHLALVGPVLALAAVSADPGGFALGSLGVFVGALVSLVIIGSFMGRGTPPGPNEQWSPLEELIVVAASGLAVTSVQYLARSRRSSIGLVAAAVVVWAVAVFSGPASIGAESAQAVPPTEGMRVRAVRGSTVVADGLRIDVTGSHCDRGSCEVIVREAQAIFPVPRRRQLDWPSWPRYELVTPPAEIALRPGGRNEVRVASALVPGSHLLVTWRRLRFGPVGSWADSQTLAGSWLVPVFRKRERPTSPEAGSLRRVPR